MEQTIDSDKHLFVILIGWESHSDLHVEDPDDMYRTCFEAPHVPDGILLLPV